MRHQNVCWYDKKHPDSAKERTKKMNKSEKKGNFVKKSIAEAAARLTKRIISAIHSARKALSESAIIKFITRKETLDNVVRLARCLGLCLAGFMFGSIPFGYLTYPLGIALVIASGRLSFFAYAGSALACLTYPALGFAFFGVNTLIYIIRKILLSDSFCESRRARLLLSVFSAVFISCALFLAASSGTFSGYSAEENLIAGCVTYIIGMPLGLLFLYPVCADARCSASAVRISLCFFCICLIMSANVLPLFGNAGSLFLACICTLVFCTLFEGNVGIPAGALFGLATLNFVFCAPLCIAAFVFLRFFERRQLLVYPLFFGAVSLCSAFIFPLPLAKTATLSCLMATAIYMPAGLVICSKRASAKLEAPLQRESVSEAYTKRMGDLSRAFGSVSKLCFGFSNRMRFPTNEEAQVLVSVCASRACRSCPDFNFCKRKQHWCDSKIAESLLSGKLVPSRLPGNLPGLCKKAVSIVDNINEEYRKLLSDRFNNNKTEILAYEYATLAKILKYTSRVSSEDVLYDAKLTRLAGYATKKLGMKNTGVTVYGSRRKTLDITGVPVSCVSIPSQELASYYSAECGELFDTPEFILDENNTFTVRFVSKEIISAEYVKVSHTKNGETVSGDTISFFRSDDSYFYALIADGMGSGRDAAMTSRLTSVFVEKLLSGGAGKGVTMELLNNLLMSKNKECFSSVDLLELDLIKRRASFIKAGAAPAYVLRSAKLFKVSSDTPPCGIIEGFCAENTSFDVFSGDVIIMLSDGITSSIDCGNSLCAIMNNAEGESFEALAGKILDMAVSMAVHDDDMSCVMVKIK